MYYATIILLMAVLPIISIAVEHVVAPTADLVLIAGHWFVFWAAGVRLTLAGGRQIINPAFTAKTIFEIADPAVNKVVTELGFANLSLGLVSLASILRPDWVLPAALIAGLYYGLAGAKHVVNGQRNRVETWAMVSDLVIFLVFAAYAIATLLRGL
jgi:hypothetical protein